MKASRLSKIMWRRVVLMGVALWPATAVADLPGDTCGDAIDLTGVLPVSVAGTTVGYLDDYDEVCLYAGSMAPDVVYRYSAAADVVVDVSLCAGLTDFDSKIYVYEDACPSSRGPWACNDDGCISPGGSTLASVLHEVILTGGHTYYIVVDGFGTAAGAYTLDISESPAPGCPTDQTVLWSAPPDVLEDGRGRSTFFDGLAGPITGVRFWGSALAFSHSAQAYSPCGGPVDISVTFSEDYPGMPGATVAEYSFTLAGEGIASAGYNGFDVYEFTVALPAPVVLPRGWIKIGTIGSNPSCLFLWTSSSQHAVVDVGSFCLLNDGTQAVGACCDERSGVCTEGTPLADCVGRFIEGGTCAEFDPACVAATGACCHADGSCEVTTFAGCPDPATCPGDVNCDGAIDFCDINPFVLALLDPAGYAAAYPDCDRQHADCDQNAAINFYDINPFVLRIGARCGSWLGPETTCGACGPAPIALPRDLPFVAMDTSCGRGHDDAGPCGADELPGETAVYELVVTGPPVAVAIAVEAVTEARFAVALDNLNTGECVGQDEATPPDGVAALTCKLLAPGAYRLRVKTLTADACLDAFTLSIASCELALGRCCLGQPAECADLSEYECEQLGGSWNGDVDCTTACGAAAGESCPTARPIGGLPFSATFDTVTYTADGPAAPCDKYGATGAMQNDAWFVWTAPADGLATATAVGDANHADVAIVVRAGCGADATLACADEVGARASTAEVLHFAAVAGQTYRLQVGDVGSHAAGGLTTVTLALATGGGACCFRDGDCQTLAALACFAQGGAYQGDATDCGGTVCPQPTPGNTCSDPIVVMLDADNLPFVDVNTTKGRGDDYRDTCLGSYDDGEDIVYRLVVPETINVAVVLDALDTGYTGMALMTGCPDGECLAMSRTAEPTPYSHFYCEELLPGVYYLLIDKRVKPAFIEQFTLTISSCAYAPHAACCVEGDCVGEIPRLECEALGGQWYPHEICSQYSDPCHALAAGGTCENPAVINIPGSLPYHSQTAGIQGTCGGGDDYHDTCLAPFDQGEDLIFKLVVTGAEATVNIQLSGILTSWALSSSCPPGAECITGGVEYLQTVTLPAGEHYLMVDSWAYPEGGCTDFLLSIWPATPAP